MVKGASQSRLDPLAKNEEPEVVESRSREEPSIVLSRFLVGPLVTGGEFFPTGGLARHKSKGKMPTIRGEL